MNFLKRNLNNTKRKSAALTNYVAPLDYQTGVSETMRRFKKELRDAGQDASSVSATIRDLSRSFSGTSTRDRPSARRIACQHSGSSFSTRDRGSRQAVSGPTPIVVGFGVSTRQNSRTVACERPAPPA